MLVGNFSGGTAMRFAQILINRSGKRIIAMTSLRSNRIRCLLIPFIAAVALQGCAVGPSQKKQPALVGQADSIPQDVRADFDSAMRLINSKEYEKGIELLNAVVTKSQKHAVPYINLAIANEKIGNTKEAEENLAAALAIDPDNPVANNELGVVYRKTGRFPEARKVYENILNKYPRFPVANKNLGILCDLYLRDYACALKGYEAYSSAVPEDKNVKIWISDVQKKIGK